MSRPLRLEFPGATYHVTSRGDRREPIYRDDVDRRAQLDIIARAMERFDASVLSYCQMGNHFHLVLCTRQGNLSRLMRHVNGVYTQAFNRRHGLVGHLFQGRFKAILVDRDAYLVALCRYVERNPVAAQLVASPEAWPWSSCRAQLGLVPAPNWLDRDTVYAHLIGRPAANGRDRARAGRVYAALVNDSAPGDASFWDGTLLGQVFMGGQDFVERMRAHAKPDRLADRQVPRKQRSRPLTWAACLAACGGDVAVALRKAYSEAGMTMTALAKESGYSISHVSRLIMAAEKVEKSGWQGGKRET